VAISFAGVMLIGAMPASAHDQLISSSPGENEHLAEAPSQVTLTFSDDVLAFEGMGAVIRISGPSGDTWQEGDATTDGSVVTGAVARDMPDGAYTLAWQVVSADGHTISGVIPFTVGEVGAAPTLPPTAEPTAVAAVAEEATPLPPVLRTVLIGIGGAVVALVLVWAISRGIRRSPTRKP